MTFAQKTKQDLFGSPARDMFLYWHKQPPMPMGFNGSDVDFVVVAGKGKSACIKAIIDYKMPYDSLTWAECVAYNDLMKYYPIYIVWSNADFIDFKISRYVGCDLETEPPEPRLKDTIKLHGQKEYITWEASIRKNGMPQKWLGGDPK